MYLSMHACMYVRDIEWVGVCVCVCVCVCVREREREWSKTMGRKWIGAIE